MKQLLSTEQIEEGVNRLALEVNEFYSDRPLTILGVLNGSIVLLADLIRRLKMSLRVGLVQANSYRGGAVDPGPLRIELAMMPDIQKRHVLLVDDIFDTGNTLSTLLGELRGRPGQRSHPGAAAQTWAESGRHGARPCGV